MIFVTKYLYSKNLKLIANWNLLTTETNREKSRERLDKGLLIDVLGYPYRVDVGSKAKASKSIHPQFDTIDRVLSPALNIVAPSSISVNPSV